MANDPSVEMAKAGFRRNHWIAAGAGVILLALLGIAWMLLTTSDEPPIRVRNGSLDVILDPPNTWVADHAEWHPSDGTNRGKWDVTVLITGGLCTALKGSGNNITIDYSDGGTVAVKPRMNKTMVGPNNYLQKKSGQLLQRSAPGFITRIRVTGGGTGNLTCTFDEASQLKELAICPPAGSSCP